MKIQFFRASSLFGEHQVLFHSTDGVQTLAILRLKPKLDRIRPERLAEVNVMGQGSMTLDQSMDLAGLLITINKAMALWQTGSGIDACLAHLDYQDVYAEQEADAKEAELIMVALAPGVSA